MKKLCILFILCACTAQAQSLMSVSNDLNSKIISATNYTAGVSNALNSEIGSVSNWSYATFARPDWTQTGFPWEESDNSFARIFFGNCRSYEADDVSGKYVSGCFLWPLDGSLISNPIVRVSTKTHTWSAGTNVVWLLRCRYIAEGEGTTNETSQIITSVVAYTSMIQATTNIAFALNRTLISTNDRLILGLERDGGAAADTFQGKVGLDMQSILQYWEAGP